MIAPDPTPYLAADAIRSQWETYRYLRHSAEIPEGASLDEALDVLRARLDRARRQACERGAEDCERRLAELGPEPEEPTIDIWGTEALRARLRESALAFRAAARAK